MSSGGLLKVMPVYGRRSGSQSLPDRDDEVAEARGSEHAVWPVHAVGQLQPGPYRKPTEEDRTRVGVGGTIRQDSHQQSGGCDDQRRVGELHDRVARRPARAPHAARLSWVRARRRSRLRSHEHLHC